MFLSGGNCLAFLTRCPQTHLISLDMIQYKVSAHGPENQEY